MIKEIRKMKYLNVNKSINRVDAYEKVTGKAKFAADFSFFNMLYAKVLRSKYPYAKINTIKTKRALTSPKVKALLVADDIPNNEFGVIIQNQQVLAKEYAYYIGDGIAMVAAETEEAAEVALELIEVDYKELPGIYDVEEASKKTALRVHPELKDNQVVHHVLRKGM